MIHSGEGRDPALQVDPSTRVTSATSIASASLKVNSVPSMKFEKYALQKGGSRLRGRH